MKTCVIFCAGGFHGLLEPIDNDAYILAADGGLAHVRKAGIVPHGVLGDFDSLGYIPKDAQVFPVEKDDTDAMLAVRQGLQAGCRRFILYGSLDGPRLDHTVANFQTLQYLADHGAVGYLVGKDQIVTVIKDSIACFPGKPKGILSVFCMGADAHGVTLEGLKYPLENGTLTAGFPLGVSNALEGKPATIRVEQGSLLLIYHPINGFAQIRRINPCV